MLALTMKFGNSIMIGDNIRIIVKNRSGVNKVIVLIDAPKDIPIKRVPDEKNYVCTRCESFVGHHEICKCKK